MFLFFKLKIFGSEIFISYLSSLFFALINRLLSLIISLLPLNLITNPFSWKFKIKILGSELSVISEIYSFTIFLFNNLSLEPSGSFQDLKFSNASDFSTKSDNFTFDLFVIIP